MISSCSDTKISKSVIAVDMDEVGFPYVCPWPACPYGLHVGYKMYAECHILF